MANLGECDAIFADARLDDEKCGDHGGALTRTCCIPNKCTLNVYENTNIISQYYNYK